MSVKSLCRVAVVSMLPLTAACATDPEVAKQEFLKNGSAFVDQQRYGEAILEYRRAVQIDPRFAEARYRLAKAYELSDDPTSAAREYIRAADLMPDNVDAQLRAGFGLLLAGNFQDARTRADAVLAKDLRNAEAHILLGRALGGLRDMDKAVDSIEQALELDPTQSTTYITLGALQYRSGDGARAEQSLKNALLIAPKSVSALVALGNYYWARDRVTEAEQLFKRAIEVDPRNALIIRTLANLYLTTNRAAEAEHYLKLAVTAAADPTGPELALADYYLATRRRADAETLLHQASKRPNGLGPAVSRLATIALADGRNADARKLLDDVLAKIPGQPRALVVKAQLLMAEQQPDAALEALKNAAAADRRWSIPPYYIGLVYVSKSEPEEAIKAFNEAVSINPLAAEAQVRLAELHLAAGRVDTGTQFAEQALKIRPTDAKAALLLLRGLINSKNFARAQQLVDSLVGFKPPFAGAQTALGELKIAQGDRRAARAAFIRALELQPDAVDPLSGLVALDMFDGRFDEARKRLNAALTRRPADVKLVFLSAQVHYGLQQLEDAEQALRKTVELNPAHMQAYSMLASVFARQKKLPDAQRQFELMIAKDPKSVYARTMVGVLHQLQNDQTAAAKAYEAVLAVNPRSAVAANNLAYMYVTGSGNLDIALQLAQTAKEQMPDDPEINDTLGWVYYRKDMATLAVPPLELSVSRDPTNPTYHFHLGLVYAKAGQKEKARAALERALSISSSFDGAEEARRTLGAL